MDNLDRPDSDKPKGNMLQNENREDEASPTDHSGLEPHPKMPEAKGEADRPHPELNKEEIEPSKTDQ